MIKFLLIYSNRSSDKLNLLSLINSVSISSTGDCLSYFRVTHNTLYRVGSEGYSVGPDVFWTMGKCNESIVIPILLQHIYSFIFFFPYLSGIYSLLTSTCTATISFGLNHSNDFEAFGDLSYFHWPCKFFLRSTWMLTKYYLQIFNLQTFSFP